MDSSYLFLIQDETGFNLGFLTKSINGQVNYRLRDAEGNVVLDTPDLEYMIEKGVPSQRERLLKTARFVKRQMELEQLRDRNDIDRDHER